MICHIEMGKVFSPPAGHYGFRRLTAEAVRHAGRASVICHFLIDRCLRIFLPKDYTQYQMDLQQCEGLAVQNQPDAPQRESVAGTAVKGAAVGAAAGAVGGKSGSKAA